MDPASSFRANVKDDLFASIVVFLVALPLCIGGVVVGWLAGCPLQVSGPAAGLTVIVWESIQAHGFQAFGLIVLAAGLIQILAAWLQIGQWFRAVSPAIVHGMLAGIGALIFAGQFHVMIDDRPHGNGLDNVRSLPQAALKGLLPDHDVMTSNQEAAWIGILTVAVIVLWTVITPKRLHAVPPVLMGVVTATVVASLFALPIQHVAVKDDLFWVLHVPTAAELSHLLDTAVLVEALGLAFIGSVETLLSATAVDKLHTGPRTRYNRELFAQGVGNAACGLIGALPMTGVIVRSAANVDAGARTRLSAILHGAWLLLFVSLLPFVLRLIPTASLGAVLVYTGYKLMNFGVVRELRTHGRGEVVIYFATMGAIVCANLMTGVLLGIALAVAKLLYTTHNLDTSLVRDQETGRYTLELQGLATFVSLPSLATTLESVPPASDIEVDFEALRHIDHACLDLLDNWKRQLEVTGGKVVMDMEMLHRLSHETRRPIPGERWLEKILG
jgi:MFS superfamily sulfate permease-like transporter